MTGGSFKRPMRMEVLVCMAKILITGILYLKTSLQATYDEMTYRGLPEGL